MASMIALASRGNIFRTVLAAIPVIIADLWIATKIAPFITGMAKDVNFKFAEGSSGRSPVSLMAVTRSASGCWKSSTAISSPLVWCRLSPRYCMVFSE